MNRVILGGEAVRAGVATRHELRRDYTTLYRGVFIRNGVEVTLRDRAVGAWLATGRTGTIAGVAAAGLHGAPWVDVDVPIDVIGGRRRPREGVVLHTDVLTDDQITTVGGLPVTTRERTAFDLGRHLGRTEALARLDALMWNQRFDLAEVVDMADRWPRLRGSAQLRELLPLVDGGAASPRESAIRLVLHDNGFPRPETQYPVLEGSRPVAFLDLAYPEYGVAVECDGNDRALLKMLEQRGWIVVPVVAEDHHGAWLPRVATALRDRGCPLPVAVVTTQCA
ncbi:MAG: hypothetical protein PGN37_21945 [Mycobacterium kyogaense]|uniref:hypothetical protein n=1 Tax=Mycobacterium kyogaense TaxID=2212479 RepID=UPI002FFA9BCC